MRKLFTLFLLSCASSSTHLADPASDSPASTTSATSATERGPLEAAAASERDAAQSTRAPRIPATPPPYPPEIHSVMFLKRTTLHKEPSLDSVAVGVIKKGTFAGVQQAVPGDDCPGNDDEPGRWIQIIPRGWTCENVVEPSIADPTAPTVASLSEEDDDAPPVRGTYGIVRRSSEAQAFASPEDALAQANGRALVGSNTVRASGRVTIDGHRYWRTSKGELIDASSISQISPSKFKGVILESGAAMPAWVRSHHHPREPITTRATPSARGERTGKLAARTIVTILETSDDGKFVRVGDRAWVARADLRVATVAAPPPGTDTLERWFDVDLDEQVLVAYEGERPVYATLVSTGKRKNPTPTAIARVVSKHEHAAMNNEKERYSVADVPWTMYYDHDFALHTSYWHDGFGGPRSHGCINLAPRDARLLFHWSSPDVPPGWSTVYGDADTPGSLVRVRSRKVPEPAFRGYARTLHEQSPSSLGVAFAQ